MIFESFSCILGKKFLMYEVYTAKFFTLHLHKTSRRNSGKNTKDLRLAFNWQFYGFIYEAKD